MNEQEIERLALSGLHDENSGKISADLNQFLERDG
jgi:hypothetical protein